MQPNRFALLLSASLIPAALHAQAANAPARKPGAAQQQAEMDAEDQEIIVRGVKPPGSVVGDIEPEVTLNPADIRSYGVNNVSDLLDELAPQTQSDRGRGGQPVVLLNGRRISSFAEIRDLPTEAILRVEILPEEVSLKYGYSADQRVVNFVLRRRFRAVVAEAGAGVASEGGGFSTNPEANLVRIRGDRRFSLNLRYQENDKLRESQRDVIPLTVGLAPTDSTDISRFRTLKAGGQTFSTNAVYSRPAFGRSTATLNGSLSRATTDGLQGLPIADGLYVAGDPLHQRTETLTGHLGAGLNGDRGHWRWSLTGNYDYNNALTRTERSDGNGGIAGNRARSISNTGNLQGEAGGPLLKVPAGSLSSNIKLGLEETVFDATSTRFGVDQSGNLSRRNANGQVNIDLPLASRRQGFLPFLGQLDANFNVAVRQLSDFGTLHTIGYGLHWAPDAKIELIASVTTDQGAPTIQQIGNPQVITPQVRMFDYLTGRTVDVTQVSGGNRNLAADDRRVMKLGLTLKPLAKGDLSIIANYLRTRTNNAIASLPEPTADIESAFPDRFVRDASGNLVRIDSSPVNFARERQDQLRYGLNFSVPIKSVMQRKFEAWLAERRAGKDVPPPFPIPERFRQRMQQQRQGQGQAGGDSAPPPPSDGTPALAGPPHGGFGGSFGGGGGHGFGGGFGGRRGPQQGQGRLQVAIYDTWTLKDTVLIRPGVPLIDLLNGGAVRAGGGQAAHDVQLQLGYANNGLGVRLSGSYQTGTTVNAGPGSTTGDLHFSGLATAGLRLFADLGRMPSLVGKGWARGTRVSLDLRNIADSRQHVRDANGDTPLRYQPAYLDPLGRTIRVSLRKLFF